MVMLSRLGSAPSTPTSHDHGSSFHSGLADDDHTQYALLAGRSGGQTLIGGSATGNELILEGNSIDASPAVRLRWDSVTAGGTMLKGQVGSEANPRWSFGFDASSRISLGFGAGGATAMTEFLTRTGTRALRLISTIGTTVVTLGAQSSTDTQPRWLLGVSTDQNSGAVAGTLSLGVGGATAVDTIVRRGADPAVVRLQNYLHLVTVISEPTFTSFAEAEGPLHLYARPPSGTPGQVPRLFYKADFPSGTGGTEIGPIGLLRGLLRRFNLALGGFEVNDATGAPGLTGISTWGLLAQPTATGSTSADAAYSPAITLTNNITATQDTFSTSGGSPLAGDIILVDSEKMMITGAGLIAIRGVLGTTAAAHSAGASVTLVGGATRTQLSADGEPCLEQDTGTTSGTNAGLEWPKGNADHSAPLFVYKFHLRHTTDLRLFVGFTDQTLATMLAADNPAGQYWGLQFSTARGDTRFQCVSKDGTTQNLQDTDWTGHPAAATKYYVVFQYDTGGDNQRVSLFDSTWNQIGTTETLTANFPSLDGAQLRLVAGIRNTAAATKRIRHHFGSFNLSPSVG